MRPRSLTARRLHDLAAAPADAPQPVRPHGGRDDDRLGERQRVDVSRRGHELDVLAFDEIEDVEAAPRVVLELVGEVEAVDGEEEFRMATEQQLPPAVPVPHLRRGRNQFRDAGSVSTAVEVREGVVDVNRTEPSVSVATEPVVEAKGVEVRRCAYLEHGVAGAARMRRPGRNQVEAVALGRVPYQVAIRIERDARGLGALGLFAERVDVGVLAQPEEHGAAGRRRHHVVRLLLRVVEAERLPGVPLAGMALDERWPPSIVSR